MPKKNVGRGGTMEGQRTPGVLGFIHRSLSLSSRRFGHLNSLSFWLFFCPLWHDVCLLSCFDFSAKPLGQVEPLFGPFPLQDCDGPSQPSI